MPEQLALRGGQVRCGQCKTVFNRDRAAGFPRGTESTEEPLTEAALGPPTLTLRNAQALESPVHARRSAPPPVVAAAATAPDSGHRCAPAAASSSPRRPPVDRFALPPRLAAGAHDRLPRRHPRASAALAAQAAYHFRDSIVTFWPVTRPAFERVCEVAGCAIRPLRDDAMSYLSIESSDLQADPAHRGLLILTATVRNRASWPLAYPHLELTLTDAQDRWSCGGRSPRPITPRNGGRRARHRGQAEFSLKVFIDASATSQAGYRLYMFYP
jgi:hypothetical protein